jgi:hypothetical protein
MKPVTVEVISHWATAFGNCAPCELVLKEAGVNARTRHQELADYPVDLKEEMIKLGDWLGELCRLYRHRICIRLIDAQSPLGFYKALVHRIRSYPSFIIEKKDVYSGWDRSKVEELLDARMKVVCV